MSPEIVDEVQGERLDVSTGEVQIVSQPTLSRLAERVNQIGPAAWPTRVSLRGGQQRELHEFDMDRLYVIDRAWECGSCPFLFFGTISGRKFYASQLFGSAEGTLQLDSVTIPEDVDRLYIVELEDEVTWLASIRINDLLNFVKDRRLVRRAMFFACQTGKAVVGQMHTLGRAIRVRRWTSMRWGRWLGPRNLMVLTLT